MAETASPRAYPSAEASNDFDDPSGEREPSKVKLILSPGAVGMLVNLASLDKLLRRTLTKYQVRPRDDGGSDLVLSDRLQSFVHSDTC